MRHRTMSLLLAGAFASGALVVSGCQSQMQLAEEHAARVLIDVVDAISVDRFCSNAKRDALNASAEAASKLAIPVQQVSSIRTIVLRKNVVKEEAQSKPAVSPTVTIAPMRSTAPAPTFLLADGDIVEILAAEGDLNVIDTPAETSDFAAPEAVAEKTGAPSYLPDISEASAGVDAASGREVTSDVPAAEAIHTQYRPSVDDHVVLKRGSSGDSVVELQNALASLGYFRASPTGYFGRATEEAVRAFQQGNSLIVDGMAGVVTRTVLSMRTAAHSS